MSITILTNIPTPYRTAFFDKVSSVATEAEVPFTVLYCSRTEPNRHWKIDETLFKHKHRFLKGLSIAWRGAYLHFCPGVLLHLFITRPRMLVCAGSWNSPTVFAAWCACQFMGIPVYFWSEGHADAVLNRTGWIARLRRAIYRGFDGFFVPNKKSERWVQSHIDRIVPIHKLPNSISGQFYLRSSDASRTESRKALLIPDETRLLVQVSQLEDKKGVLELAAAFKDAQQRLNTDCRLAFVGTGTLLEPLRRIAVSCPQISVTGHLTEDGVRSWLWAADAFVLNTKIDPNPLAPVEAAFAGLPLVLSSRAGNCDDLLSGGEVGVRIEDPASPREQIEQVIQANTFTLREMGRNAQQMARQQYDQDEIARNFTTFCSSTLRPRQYDVV